MNDTPTRARAFEESEDAGRNPTANPTMGEIVARRFGRRELLRGVLATTAITAALGPMALASSARAAAGGGPGFDFEELEAGVDEHHHVAPGHDAQVLIRWGDPVLPEAPSFDPMAQSEAAQRRQFGYNNDFVGYFPIDGSSGHGLLAVNHEYTNEELMFPGAAARITREGRLGYLTRELAMVEMAAHGGSIIEVRKGEGGWEVVPGSRFARRITASGTVMELTGPAAGHSRLRTGADPSGREVLGMINNCAGGVTPWGTWLSAEENFHGYFTGELPEGHAEARNYARYGVPGNSYGWGRHVERFDLAKEPNEPNRFGWMVEIDPYDPGAIPKKRTALGRFKHEGANTILSRDGRVVAYMGDDERFDYIYRFVTAGRYDPDDRAANMDLLDEGTLSVARFDEDGSMEWLPLVFGEGPLTPQNGFESQADVVIETRRAADLLGATKMDRPEDVEPNPRTRKVYAMLTNNTKRKADQTDAANPRADNRFGHIIEMTPPGGDHAADRWSWDILVRCGDPSIAEVGATFAAGTSEHGWFGMPDNCAFDAAGRLWVATDGNSALKTGRSDGLWAVETEGEGRGTSRHFFRCPVGAEMCGPSFTPDGRTLFLAVQHPGEEDAQGNEGTFETPATRWPDFEEGMPPRPSVVVVVRKDGGVIAG
ncbi:PhoX family protein [Marinimicrococcus flavescens]|uniref:PhoX family phosphatase n=1 Tax=Marinimicrococcus flavescens TaxID=3031815 RepID=A0AAP3UY69_9PROT|nr:PhoX family phosphatase [Marinimicrococcus flavescens]